MKKLTCSFYGIPKDMHPYLRSKLKGYQITVKDKELIPPLVANPDTEILGVFVHSKIGKDIINQMPKLKFIAAMSTGYDHIDLATAKKNKVIVSNVPTYGENTVAEHAMALILALSRRIVDSVQRVKQGPFDYEGLRGFDLKGKTVGVIGTGHIGLHLIKMLNGFETNVIGYNPSPNKDLEKKYNFTYVSFKKLLETSDIISLHVPLLPDTYHLINKRNIKQVKKGAYIINTARGPLIDPEALVWALESDHIAGAGLDVLETEAFLEHPNTYFFSESKDRHVGANKSLDAKTAKVSLMNEIIIDHPRTVVTPHNAFNSAEALKRIVDTTVENILAFSAGKPQNVVSLKK